MTYLILFCWSFLAATILPVGSEPMLVGLIRADGGIIVLVVIATIGNFLGGCTLWWMGRRAGALATARLGKSAAGARAASILTRYGRPALALSWIPVLGDIIIGLAGASGIPFSGFAGWAIVGKGLRYAAVAWLAIQI